MNVITIISVWTIPVSLLVIPAYAWFKGVKVYEVFCEGAKEGMQTAFHIIPYLVAIFTALAVLRESSALDHLLGLVAPFFNLFGFPAEVLPLAVIRPISGSGALAVLGDLLQQHGPESWIGLTASTIQGSTETTLYVLTVYFGAVGITRTRHALLTGLLADLTGFITAITIVSILFPII